MSYLVRYSEIYPDGTIEDGVYHVPNDISDKKAKELIKKNQAVIWLISPEAMKKYESIEEEES